MRLGEGTRDARYFTVEPTLLFQVSEFFREGGFANGSRSVELLEYQVPIRNCSGLGPSIQRVEALLQDTEQLKAILTYHVVPGRVMAADVIRSNGGTPATVQGQSLTIKVVDGKVMVDGATVVTADVGASNGVIHVIDTVVLPKPAGK